MGKKALRPVRTHGEKLAIEFYVESGIRIKYSDNSLVKPEELEQELEVEPIVKKKEKKSKAREVFYRSLEWIDLREVIYTRDGRICAKCGATEKLNIDHILPRYRFPQYALCELNLRVLCWTCNRKKAFFIETDVFAAIDNINAGRIAI